LEGELAALVPELAPVLGTRVVALAGSDPERSIGRVRSGAGRSLTYEALSVFLRRLSRTRPLLLILDDLQDADAATVELLHFLARRLGPTRLLAVGAMRRETGDRVLAALDRVAVRVDLGPLDLESVGQLVAAEPTLVSDPTTREELGARIWRRTRGNPSRPYGACPRETLASRTGCGRSCWSGSTAPMAGR
jgi:predicted ATPase